MTCPDKYTDNEYSCKHYIKDGSVSKMIAVAYVINTVLSGGTRTGISHLEEYFNSYIEHCQLDLNCH